MTGDVWKVMKNYRTFKPMRDNADHKCYITSSESCPEDTVHDLHYQLDKTSRLWFQESDKNTCSYARWRIGVDADGQRRHRAQGFWPVVYPNNLRQDDTVSGPLKEVSYLRNLPDRKRSRHYDNSRIYFDYQCKWVMLMEGCSSAKHMASSG